MNVRKVITLKEGERVLAVVRHHGMTLILPLGFAFVLVAAPFFLMIPLFAMGGWGAATFLVASVAGLLLAARTFVTWRWNAFIVTTRRVVDVDQRGFFDRTVSEAGYDKVQDVSYRIRGIVGSVFNIGTIVIQTAGSSTNLELPHVGDPKGIHHLITEAMAQAAAGGGENGADLVGAAADMSDTEARAFLVELQEKISENDGGAPGRRRFTKRPVEDHRHPLDPGEKPDEEAS